MRLASLSALRSAVTALALVLGLGTVTWAQNAATQNAPTTIPPAGADANSAPTSPPNNAPNSPNNPNNLPTSNPQPATEQPQGQDATPQLPSGPDAGDDPGRFVFKKQVEEVVLHATVVDEQGRLVTNLGRDAFSIFQNSVQQPVMSFRREDVPVAMGIVIDNSGSMRDKRDKVNQAVLNLIRASNPQDEIFVVNFGQKSYLDQDFTSDVNLLQAALHQVSTRGSTALYDAIVASAVHLQNNPRLDKKVLLVITDGQDNMSRETLQETIRQLQPGKGLTLYAIGLTEDGFTRNGRDALQSLATTTGGVAFFPDSLEEADGITRAVARDIRSQYTLTYKPQKAAGQTGYQPLRIEARSAGQGRLIVRTRTGYYEGQPVH